MSDAKKKKKKNKKIKKNKKGAWVGRDANVFSSFHVSLLGGNKI